MLGSMGGQVCMENGYLPTKSIYREAKINGQVLASLFRRRPAGELVILQRGWDRKFSDTTSPTMRSTT
jgi:hypothetical protein